MNLLHSIKKSCLIWFCALPLVGCIKQPWQEYYAEIPHLDKKNIEFCQSVRMEKRDDIDANIFFEMFSEGYLPFGYVEFNGTGNYLDEKAIAAEARARGACVCYYGASYTHTESTIELIPSALAQISQSGFSVQNTASSGSQIGTRERKMFNYLVVYAGKDLQKHTWGIVVADPPPAYKKTFNTETGLLIIAVQKDSTLAKAAVERGDVLVSLNKKPVTRELLRKEDGKGKKLVVYRDGKMLELKL
jgi:hypothetical protein